jgi:hypothetical protein
LTGGYRAGPDTPEGLSPWKLDWGREADFETFLRKKNGATLRRETIIQV